MNLQGRLQNVPQDPQVYRRHWLGFPCYLRDDLFLGDLDRTIARRSSRVKVDFSCRCYPQRMCMPPTADLSDELLNLYSS